MSVIGIDNVICCVNCCGSISVMLFFVIIIGVIRKCGSCIVICWCSFCCVSVVLMSFLFWLLIVISMCDSVVKCFGVSCVDSVGCLFCMM